MPLGKILVFSAPSGAGKTTIVRHLVKVFPSLCFSISATTRPPRKGETDGKDYYFLSQEAFQEKLRDQEFIEHQQVYRGLYYGTLKSEITRLRETGKNVVLDVDVQGGINLKKYYQYQALSVFVQPPSLQALAQRLKSRDTESPEALKERLEKAQYEMIFAEQFDVILLNDTLEEVLPHAERLIADFIGCEVASRQPPPLIL